MPQIRIFRGTLNSAPAQSAPNCIPCTSDGLLINREPVSAGIFSSQVDLDILGPWTSHFPLPSLSPRYNRQEKLSWAPTEPKPSRRQFRLGAVDERSGSSSLGLGGVSAVPADGSGASCPTAAEV
jgi:hypothetical protein